MRGQILALPASRVPRSTAQDDIVPLLEIRESWAFISDETSQLYHAPWIDRIRATTLGGLVLGFGFLWSDIACYTVGVACAMCVDLLLRRPN